MSLPHPFKTCANTVEKSRWAKASAIGLPGDLRGMEQLAQMARQHEEKIAETVEVSDHDRGDLLASGSHIDDTPFGPAADGAADMGLRNGGMAARQNEVAHGLQVGIHAVHSRFQCGDMCFGDLWYLELIGFGIITRGET